MLESIRFFYLALGNVGGYVAALTCGALVGVEAVQPIGDRTTLTGT
jgi:hypothetical protein